MNKAALKETLRGAGLRFTQPRAEVLQLFNKHDTALAQADLEKMLPQDFDRITLYRILRSFEANGLLHKVPDDNGTNRFALCGHSCSEDLHHDEHVHFRCTSCGKTLCLSHTPIPKLQLPQGYEASEAKLLVDGVCAGCNTN
jgi:Fur family ferric uptake transcriptional regulator